MATIEQMLDDLLKREGGYSNNPSDRGGATNWGITEHVARLQGYTGDMRDMPRNEALDIYRRIYWIRPAFDQVAALSLRVAEELFDTGVNMGPGMASEFLQRLLTALNRGGKDYADLKPDGRIGTQTLNALRSFIQARGREKAERILLRGLDALQGARYIELAEKYPNQEEFLNGWLDNRIGNVA